MAGDFEDVERQMPGLMARRSGNWVLIRLLSCRDLGPQAPAVVPVQSVVGAGTGGTEGGAWPPVGGRHWGG